MRLWYYVCRILPILWINISVFKVKQPKPKITFTEGENVRVIDGPFATFTGVVDSIKPDKGKVVVLVSIFGRATPVELDFTQVEKA